MTRRRLSPAAKLQRRMKRYRTQTLKVARRNPHEKWMANILETTGEKWLPQYIFGQRIFDFFCPRIGVAIEVDGPDHSEDWDHYRDADNWWARRVVVLRVRNHNGEDAAQMLRELPNWGQWYPRYKAALPTSDEPRSGEATESPRTRQTPRLLRRPVRPRRKPAARKPRARRR